MTNPYLDKREPVQSIDIGPDDIWSYSVSYDAPRYTLATAPQRPSGRVWRWTIDPRNLPRCEEHGVRSTRCVKPEGHFDDCEFEPDQAPDDGQVTVTVMDDQDDVIAAMNAKMAHDDRTHTGPGYDDDLAAAVWDHREQIAMSRDR